MAFGNSLINLTINGTISLRADLEFPGNRGEKRNWTHCLALGYMSPEVGEREHSFLNYCAAQGHLIPSLGFISSSSRLGVGFHGPWGSGVLRKHGFYSWLFLKMVGGLGKRAGQDRTGT